MKPFSFSLAILLAVNAAAQTDAVSFTKDIRPIFERNCLSCHGSSQQLSGLSLLTRESALRGGSSGTAIVPGKSGESAIIRRLTGSMQPGMPLGGKLGDGEIALVRRWIDEGALWEESSGNPVTAAPGRITEGDRNWWAFRKPIRHDPPAVDDQEWNRNPIDAFIFAKLRENKLKPASAADNSTLVRRAYLDLTGLPPRPEDVDAFQQDRSSDAFSNLVNGLLASSHYGERWGRHWLDVARYADSGGYEQDFTYPDAWRYRDYVIRAFNQDKPYDQFIREQIAGDEFDGAGQDALIATGFNRVGATVGFREKVNPQYRYIYLDDMIGTTTRAFLGLTVSCARCHDHKFDPISQLDYYRLMAVYYPYVNYNHPLASSAEVEAHQRRTAAVEAQTAPLRQRIREIEEPYRQAAFESKLAAFPADIQAAVRAPPELRTEGQKLLAAQVLSIRGGNYRALMKPQDRAAADALNKQIQELNRKLPAPLPVAMGIREWRSPAFTDGSGR